ncbi:MAG: Planctomycete cytochrome [Verrucomicrobiales bacterium]|nr:Planctomycete cytochrome [Verrucomicrobiales bacterium]
MKKTFLTVGLLVAAATSNFAAPHEGHDEAWDISKIDMSKLPPASTRTDVTYEKDVAPLLKASCVRCHGAEKPKARLRLDSKEGILKGGSDGKVVVPGDSKKSLIVAAAARVNDDVAMPPKRKSRGPGGPGGAGGEQTRPNGAPQGGPGGKTFTPPKPLTAEQVGVLRAWIDQGAK